MTHTLSAPIAACKPHAMSEHGGIRTDEYFWLRERDNPDVIAYLQAENAFTDAMTTHTKLLQEQIFAEMKGRIKETDLDVPVQIDEYAYYSRTETGKQYPIHCRKHNGPNAPEQILLDENALAQGHAYFQVGVYEVSPDHRWLAYAVDFAGDEIYMLAIKNLETGEHAPERIPNVYYGVEWANDNRTLFYNTLDSAMRPYRVYRHAVGTDASSDALVYEEHDELFGVNIGKTADKRYIKITSHAFGWSEVHVLDADFPNSEFRVVQPREKKVEYSVDHHADGWIIHTDADGARNFKLMTAPDVASGATPGRAHWREWVAHRDDVYVEWCMPFKQHFVRVEREGGLRRLRITNPDGTNVRNINFPESSYVVWPQGNEMHDTQVVRFTYQSPITPEQVVDYDMRAGTWTVRKQQEIPSGYDAAMYVTERIEATAPDGARVPMSVVYRKGVRDGGSAPLLLYGYGSYGATVEPGFDARRLSLLDRGMIYAMAHIRGGAEMGREWYESGRLMFKKNSFTDFIACAEHLVANGYTACDKLAIRGISAGGLLMGAVTTMRPEMFRVVVAEVPFMDVISTMFDLSIPLTAGELDQWGDPRDEAFYRYMLSYSPYDNIAARDYSHMLVTAGLNDPRVQYWEPAKFVAKLRAMKTDSNTLLLKTNLGAGHSGASGRYDSLHEEAFKYAFVLDRLGCSTS